nr:transcription factor MYB36-like [Ipomoea trifida]
MVGSQPHQFPLPNLIEVQENCANTANVSSYNPQVSAACGGYSTSFAYNNNNENSFGTSWFGNGGIEEDVFRMDMMSSSTGLSSSSSPSSSSPSCFDHLMMNYGFDFQDNFAPPNITHNFTNHPSNGFQY